MRAAVIDAQRRVSVAEVDTLPLQPGQVRVAVVRCGICGSDLHMREMPERFPAGCVIGHEISGTVVEVADEESAWKPGDEVAVYHSVSCGECDNCAAGEEHLCVRAAVLSLGLGAVRGGYAQHVVVPEATLFKLYPRVAVEDAALAEPLAIGLHGINKAGVDPGEPAVVLGAGPIGVMTAIGLRLRGHKRVVVVEPNEHRRERAELLGFVATSPDDAAQSVRAEFDRPPAVVFECSGAASAVALAVELLSYHGRIVLQGRPMSSVPLPQAGVLVKELELVGAVSCTAEEFREAVEHLASAELDVGRIVTATIGLADIDETFDDLLTPTSQHLKVLVDPQR